MISPGKNLYFQSVVSIILPFSILLALQSHITLEHKFCTDEVTHFRSNLLTHYDKSKRDLPWRKLV